MSKIISEKINISIFVVLILLIGFVFVFSPVSLKKIAQAVTGSYNRAVGDTTLTIDDWNYLDEDFLLTDGSNSMLADLDMGGNRITNVNTTNDPNDAANVGYVTTAIAGAATANGDVFVNWGDDDCPIGTTGLYGGFAFSASYDTTSGGSNPVCVQSGDAGMNASSFFADNLYPLVTGSDADLPVNSLDPLSTIAGDSIIKCSLCFNPLGTCYEHYGSHSCGSTFSSVYDGYVLGSYGTDGNLNHWNSTQRACVNRDFDASESAGGQMGAMWYGSRILNNFGLGAYTPDAFIKCSLCCK